MEVDGATRHRVLYITGADPGPEASVLQGQYGWVDGRPVSVKVNLTQEAQTTSLSLVTGSNSSLAVSSTDGNTFTGIFVPSSGKSKKVRLSRVDMANLASTGTPVRSEKVDWDKRVAGITPGPDDIIWVIAHSAEDCPLCFTWKLEKYFVERWVKEHPNVRLAVIERPQIAGEEERAMYPAELAHWYERLAQRKGLRTGVPSFDLVMGKSAVYYSWGLSSWKRSTFPALKELESRRQK